MSETSHRPPCDAIFRGGITSGVIYPGFVATLAREYRFARIGGASAGAIAAGLTAAAEYGRRTGAVPDAFEKLAATANDVGGGKGSVTNLGKLFQPTERLRGAHRVLMAGMWLLGARWRWMAGAAVTGLLLLWLLLSVPGLLAWLIVVSVGVLGWLTFRTLKTLAEEGMGLCAGTRGTAITQDMETLRREGALADWLHAEIQRVAGRSVGKVAASVAAGGVADADRPLTMGDLWGADPAKREIDLLLTTTNVTQQLGHRFPYLEKTRDRLFFRRDTLAKVVPPDIVAWMEHAARPHEEGRLRAPPEYLRIPDAKDLPVLLGVRMSLSFPGLIAAVPLYARDHGETGDELPPPTPTAEKASDFVPRRLWFSDGGITSNFPISLFDAPLPRYPTFCITLRGATAEEIRRVGPPGAEKVTPTKPGTTRNRLVVMAEKNEEQMAPRFLSDDATLLGFVSAILDTARNAQENELMLLPGQRDRIVHVLTRNNEGGLNLTMPADVIKTLSERGADAAWLMAKRFPAAGPQPGSGISLDWRNHRWVRFRAVMAAFERLMAQVAAGAAADAQQPPRCDIATLIAEPPSHDWAKEPADQALRAAAARRAYEQVLALAAALRAEAEALAGAPPGRLPEGSVFDTLRGGFGAPVPATGLVTRPLSLDPRETAIYR